MAKKKYNLTDMEVRRYARKLYLTPDEAGEHKYTYNEIAKLVNGEFSGQMDRICVKSTLNGWVHGIDPDTNMTWKEEWEKAVLAGISQVLVNEAKKNMEERREMDELVTNAISNCHLTRQEQILRILKTSAYIVERKCLSIKELIDANPQAIHDVDNADIRLMNDIYKTMLEHTKQIEASVVNPYAPIQIIFEEATKG